MAEALSVSVAVESARGGDPAAAANLYSQLMQGGEPAARTARQHYDLGQLALALERPREALEHLDAALALDPDLSPAHVDRGRVLFRIGRDLEGIQALCRAVAIDPDTHAALNRLKWYLGVGGNEGVTDRLLRHQNALHRIAGRGLNIATVIDVGASDGHWAVEARPVWPDAHFHLVEAFEHWRPSLEKACAENAGFSYALAAAGEKDGQVWFENDPAAPYGGVASSEGGNGKWKVPQISLSEEVCRHGLKGPFAIKLDTHGFELPILVGAEGILPQTNLVIIEVYVFNIASQSLIFHEICQWMAERGFRPIDMAAPLWRPHDNALWQFDLFFVRSDRPEFSYIRYEKAE